MLPVKEIKTDSAKEELKATVLLYVCISTSRNCLFKGQTGGERTPELDYCKRNLKHCCVLNGWLETVLSLLPTEQPPKKLRRTKFLDSLKSCLSSY